MLKVFVCLPIIGLLVRMMPVEMGRGALPRPKPLYYATRETMLERGFAEAAANKTVILMENREDAHNVGQWHWTERDCTAWCRERLRALLLNKVLVKTKWLEIRITKLRRFKGDASIMNRRGRTIAIWDISFNAEWTGRRNHLNAQEVQGNIAVKMAHDEDDEEPQITIEKDSRHQHPLSTSEDANMLLSACLNGSEDRASGKYVLQEVLLRFLGELKSGSDLNQTTMATS
eukprot:jgi/Bigna1/88230/estExt_fgenesh1_pg.C_290126